MNSNNGCCALFVQARRSFSSFSHGGPARADLALIALFALIDTVAMSVAMAVVAAFALTTAAALFILVYLFSALAGEIYNFGVTIRHNPEPK